MVKPDPAIFHLTLQKLGFEASESIFIDDNPRHVEAAAQLGIHAIQFESAQQLKDDLAGLSVAL